MIDSDLNSVSIQIRNDHKFGLHTFTEQITNPQLDLLSKRIDQYTYYPSGDINIILLNRYSPNKLISTKSIKHFTDDRQPISTIISKDHP